MLYFATYATHSENVVRTYFSTRLRFFFSKNSGITTFSIQFELVTPILGDLASSSRLDLDRTTSR
jgi:hypothetical protein